MRQGESFAEGRARFVADVLLHESVHQWHSEITGQIEESYHGHGPAFAATCNQIGAALGLPPVRSMKRRGSGAAMPSCAQWPIYVRPADFYPGAYAHAHADDAQAQAQPAVLAALLDQIITDVDAGRLADARAALVQIRRLV